MTLQSISFSKIVVLASIAVAIYNPWSGIASVSVAIALLVHDSLTARAKVLDDARDAQIGNLRTDLSAQKEIVAKLVEDVKRHSLGKLTR